MAHDFDLVVIGAGSGGTRASRLSAGFGARVAVVEESRLGGTSVNLGCIPKKLFVYAAHYGEDFAELRKHKDVEIARLNRVYAKLLDDAGVTRIEGRARLVDAHSVAVGERRITAEHILVATGSWPQVPQIPGRELAITSNEAFHLERLPRRALVVGGGYIALEFASIFHGLGVETALSYRGMRLLRGFDAELGARMAEEMSAKGLRIHFGAEPAALARRPDGNLEVSFGDGSRGHAELVMFATGRRPNSAALGLEAAGVKLGADGAVIVDAYAKSSVDSIHAIGDITNRLNLTPVATAEGMALAKTLFDNQPTAMDHENVATAVFSDPNLATVGLSEEQARERHGKVDIYKSAFRALKHTLGGHEERTFMKLVVDAASQRVLGAHMLGPEAGEIIQGMAIAVKLGATKAQFDATIGIHPTAAEEFVTMRDKSA